MCAIRLIASSSHKVNDRVQSLLLNYLSTLLHSGDFILVYYQVGELEYIHHNKFMQRWQCMCIIK